MKINKSSLFILIFIISRIYATEIESLPRVQAIEVPATNKGEKLRNNKDVIKALNKNLVYLDSSESAAINNSQANNNHQTVEAKSNIKYLKNKTHKHKIKQNHKAQIKKIIL